MLRNENMRCVFRSARSSPIFRCLPRASRPQGAVCIRLKGWFVSPIFKLSFLTVIAGMEYCNYFRRYNLYSYHFKKRRNGFKRNLKLEIHRKSV